MTTEKTALLEAVLAEKGIELRESYREQSVLCPWHDDKRSSATVNVEEGLFFCFTCGVGGDAYALIMHDRGVSFADAQRYAERYLNGSDDEVPRGGVLSKWVPPRARSLARGNSRWIPPRLRKGA